MEKKEYEKLKNIKTRIEKGEKTTFQERNILNIYTKRMDKLKSKKNTYKYPSKFRYPKITNKYGYQKICSGTCLG